MMKIYDVEVTMKGMIRVSAMNDEDAIDIAFDKAIDMIPDGFYIYESEVAN